MIHWLSNCSWTSPSSVTSEGHLILVRCSVEHHLFAQARLAILSQPTLVGKLMRSLYDVGQMPAAAQLPSTALHNLSQHGRRRYPSCLPPNVASLGTRGRSESSHAICIPTQLPEGCCCGSNMFSSYNLCTCLLILSTLLLTLNKLCLLVFLVKSCGLAWRKCCISRKTPRSFWSSCETVLSAHPCGW